MSGKTAQPRNAYGDALSIRQGGNKSMGINKAMVAGIVAEEPAFFSNSFFGNALQVKLDINRKDLGGRVERLTCLIINDSLIDRGLEEIHTGDYLVCQSARIVTLEYIREKYFVCPHCGEESRRLRRATESDIVLYDFNLSHGISLDDSVGINRIVAMGIVRNPIRKRAENVSKSIPAKFQLVVNRPKGLEQHLKDSAPEGFSVESFDLPQVACFGRVSDHAREYVKRGDFVLVEGVIQEREFVQDIPFRCKHCGEYSEQSFKYPTHEIIAAKVTPQRITLEEAKEQMVAGSVVNDLGESNDEMEEAPVEEALEHMKDTNKAIKEKREARKEARKAGTAE